MTENESPRHQKDTKKAQQNRNNTTITSIAMSWCKNPPHLYEMVGKWMRYQQYNASCSVVFLFSDTTNFSWPKNKPKH
jgi:hypothetical protein